MDTGRLPAYRSSYRLRFHPYPRIKPSAREMIVAPTWKDEFDDPFPTNTPQLESGSTLKLDQAIHGADVHDNETQLRRRRLSMSSLVIDLALAFMRKLSLKHD